MTDPSILGAVAARTALFDKMQAIAVQETLPHFRVPIAIDNKHAASGGFDPVTAADRGCEAALRALIEETFPEDGILGEEYGSMRLEAPFVWIIDPVDGTRAFVAGVPLWGMLVGLACNGVPVAGLCCQPFIGEAFQAADGQATWTKGDDARTLKTRACSALDAATLMTTTPALFDTDERQAYDALEQQTRSVRYGTDWYGYALVASGTADIVVESGLSPYDIMPLVPIIEAAGGAVADWRGMPLPRVGEAFDGQVIAVGDRSLLEPAVGLLGAAAHSLTAT